MMDKINAIRSRKNDNITDPWEKAFEELAEYAEAEVTRLTRERDEFKAIADAIHPDRNINYQGYIVMKTHMELLEKQFKAALLDMMFYMRSSKRPCECCKYYEPLHPNCDWESCQNPEGCKKDEYSCWEWRGVREGGGVHD